VGATDPDGRAAQLVEQMTLDEKIGLVHAGLGFPLFGRPMPEGAIGSAGFNPGVPRLGIGPMQESDASLGVANPGGVRPGDVATALPAGLLLAATFDRELARASGELAGAEARSKGFNVLLAGGANLIREPRNGRNFEYLSEDPLLTGVIAGESIAGVQSAGVVSTLKHLALNAQETGRVMVSSEISEAPARESDLLAFELALEIGEPGSVMTGYNRYNGEHCSESSYLLTSLLKGDWGFPGFVMSDWGATHSAVEAALAGLDRQSGEELDREVFFGEPLREAVADGRVRVERLDDMVRRILRALFAAGVLDEGWGPREVDFGEHADLAQSVAEQGIVALKNDGVLPLAESVRRVAVIGGRADVGVLSGGGSSQVTPPGSFVREPEGGVDSWISQTYLPSSPMRALQTLLPDVEIVSEAADADVAIVFATQWMREGTDAPDLGLPEGQDELIAAVAADAARTVVVLETGGPVTMPWLDDVDAVVEAWYPGSRGGEAIAAVLTGRVNPSGRLPVSFPRGVQQLPRVEMRDPAATTSAPGEPRHGEFSEDYDIEGSDVGYRWFEREALEPLFPFGFGLSYTTFEHSDLTAELDGERLTVSVGVTNSGDRPGIDTPQFYAAPASGAYPARLVGWARVSLEAGESGRATATVDPRLVARFDADAQEWQIEPGRYVVSAGENARDRPLSTTIELPAARLPAVH
jgi:beta-glucosidase